MLLKLAIVAPATVETWTRMFLIQGPSAGTVRNLEVEKCSHKGTQESILWSAPLCFSLPMSVHPGAPALSGKRAPGRERDEVSMSRSSKWDTISPSLDWLLVSGCFDLESGLHQPPEGVALIGQLTSSEGWEGEGHRAGRCGGDCWQENLNFRNLAVPCPSPSAWEPGGRLVRFPCGLNGGKCFW